VAFGVSVGRFAGLLQVLRPGRPRYWGPTSSRTETPELDRTTRSWHKQQPSERLRDADAATKRLVFDAFDLRVAFDKLEGRVQITATLAEPSGRPAGRHGRDGGASGGGIDTQTRNRRPPETAGRRPPDRGVMRAERAASQIGAPGGQSGTQAASSRSRAIVQSGMVVPARAFWLKLDRGHPGEAPGRIAWSARERAPAPESART
jgi:hypothetical protein